MTRTAPLVPSSGIGRRSNDSLLSVLRVIPARCYERSTAKGLGYVARAVVVYLAALTLLALTNTWWLVLPLWILAGFAVAGLFVLGHDAAHGALFDSKRLNRNLGARAHVAVAARLRSVGARA